MAFDTVDDESKPERNIAKGFVIILKYLFLKYCYLYFNIVFLYLQNGKQIKIRLLITICITYMPILILLIDLEKREDSVSVEF